MAKAASERLQADIVIIGGGGSGLTAAAAAEDDPIPGLYAAGIETGGTDWDSYNMWLSAHSFGFALNSGRIAGEEAARYVSDR